MLFDTRNIIIDELHSQLLTEKNIQLEVARLDKIHPVISGNKLFKLHYFLEEALLQQRPVATFGGAWSNHLAATSYSCKIAGLPCTGIVRGEEPTVLSPTLLQCIKDGMQLIFLSREKYKSLSAHPHASHFSALHADTLMIPEGGYHPAGAKGASLIMDAVAMADAGFICTALGTATTVAGLLQKAAAHQQIIAVPVLKNITDLPERLLHLNGNSAYNNLITWDDYHFGGYAKKTPALLQFMNEIYEQYKLPTDFVYTSKMLFAVMDKIKNNWFAQNSKILCLHTGGLQGNQSLPKGSLIF